MSAFQITENFYFIERGYLNSNQFLFRGERPVLIDTGYITHLDHTRALVSALGVDPRNVALILTTHCHCDHVGGNRFFQEQSGCEVALHPLGKRWMDSHDDWNPWWRYFDQQAVFFDATRGIEDGEKIAIGKREWEAIYAPGHARDLIVLYNRDDRVLISSDALMENDTPPLVPAVEGEDCLENALYSLEKIEELDVRLVFPGHGSPFEDVKTALARARKCIERYREKPEEMGREIIKKAIIFQLLIRGRASEQSFSSLITGSPWYRDLCERYLGGEREAVYQEIMGDFLGRGIVFRKNGMLGTVVKP